MRRPRPKQRRSDGYTLIELMITVAIVGILSALAIPAFRGYLQKSRAQEAIEFLGVIKLRQESYRSEFGQYCNVATLHPTGGGDDGEMEGTETVAWTPAPGNWRQLGANPGGSVRFSFNTMAGAPTTTPPNSLFNTWSTWAIDTNDFWYVAEAVGNLDRDETRVIFGTVSGMKEIWCSQAKGWE